MKKVALGCGAIAVLLVLVVLMGGCGAYNSLVNLSQDTDAKWAQVQSQYQRRLDLIPNLVSTVQGAANFEKSTLTEVMAARAQATQVKIDPSNITPEKLAQFQAAQGQVTSSLSRLLAVAENYPT